MKKSLLNIADIVRGTIVYFQNDSVLNRKRIFGCHGRFKIGTESSIVSFTVKTRLWVLGMVKIEGVITISTNYHTLGFPFQIGHIFVLGPIFCLPHFVSAIFGADVKSLLGIDSATSLDARNWNPAC